MNKTAKNAAVVVTLFMTLHIGSALAQMADSRYAAKGGEVYDKKTKLTWQRCSVGQRWKGIKKGCVGSIKLYTFDAAQKLRRGVWRMPTKDELATLVDLNKIAARQKPPMIDETAFPNMDLAKLVYWTSTDDGKLFAWTVIFGESETYLYSGPRKQTLAVRLVRDKR